MDPHWQRKESEADIIERRIHECEHKLADSTENRFKLAILYMQRIRGSCARNMEKSIELCGKVLTVFTRKVRPFNWATTTTNLANAYSHRIHGSEAANIDKAIKLYEESLLVYTRNSYPAEWAGTTNNLAVAYRRRIHGSQAANIDKAIKLYEESLLVYTRNSYPAKYTRNTMWQTVGDLLLFWVF